jgi:hypothetical protein
MLYHVQKGILQSVALVQEHTGHKLLTNVVVAREKVGGDFKELDDNPLCWFLVKEEGRKKI